MAIKCDNCSNGASYTTADPGVNPANYCTSCLPHWLHDRANSGHFPLVETLEAPVEVAEAPAEEKSKKKAPVKSTAVKE